MFMIVTTTDSIPGHKIAETYGLVWAHISVDADHPDLAAAVKRARKMIEAEADAFRRGSSRAAAIIGLRLALTDTQVIAYGTAVKLG